MGRKGFGNDKIIICDPYEMGQSGDILEMSSSVRREVFPVGLNEG